MRKNIKVMIFILSLFMITLASIVIVYGGNIIGEISGDEYLTLNDTSSVETLSGTCGKNLTWVLDAEGTLTISGSGYMSESRLWSNNVNIKKVVMENGVLNISEGAFEGCTNLSTVELPESLKTIESYAFMYCSNISSIEIPDGVTDIRNYVFSGCTNLSNIILPDYMVSIGCSAFNMCNNLISVKIPEGITELDSTFGSCYKLESVELPSTLLVIGTQTFSYCYNLTNVEIPLRVVLIDSYAFDSCESLKNISLPASVQEIGAGAFISCRSLESVDIPYGVRTIYDNSFNSCIQLQSVTIPVTVDEIGIAAFVNCSVLSDVYYTGSEEQWNKVNIGNNNQPLLNATMHFLNSETYEECIIENKMKLKEGEYANWLDRVILPPFAQEFCEWLEESVDGDGEEDILISAATASGYPVTYHHDIYIPIKCQSKEELIIKLARESNAAEKAAALVYRAFRHDHPEVSLFRADVFSYGVGTEMLSDNEGKIHVQIGIYLNHIESEEEYCLLLETQKKAIADILADIPENLSIYEQVKRFNSYLTMNNGYNTSDVFPDSSHYAVTALVGNYGVDGPVCEAYAKAFKLLCDARGIPCELITGKTKGAPWGVGHAWNAVQMEDGNWYAVDVTWNDPSTRVTTSPISGAENEHFLLVGSDTVVEGYKFSVSHEASYFAAVIYLDNYPKLSKTRYMVNESGEQVFIGFNKNESGTTYVYEDGSFAKGWKTIEGKTYRFDENGILFEGESMVYGSQTLWFGEDHALLEGMIEEDGGYRFYINGVAQYGWVDTDGDGERDSYFYTTSKLRCEEDRILFDGVDARRFFLYDEETGHMERANGFYTDEKGTQYFIDGLGAYGWITSDGVSITDKPGITLSDVYYFAYGDGLNFYMVEDETKMIGGVVREFDENHLVKSYTGWATNKTTGNANYYVEGVLQQGWCETPDGWVYLSRSENLANNVTYGDVFYGWRKIGGKVYYFRASTSTPQYTVISDPMRQLTYNGVRSTYYINQTPANGSTLVGSDYYITNPPFEF